MCVCGLAWFLFNGISTIVGNSLSKPCSCRGTVVVHLDPILGVEGVNTFPNGISLKVNVIALRFERAY